MSEPVLQLVSLQNLENLGVSSLNDRARRARRCEDVLPRTNAAGARAQQVVQVAQAGPTMKQRDGWVLGHAAVAVGAGVTTVSATSRTQRIPDTLLSAETKCISEVS